MALVNKPDESIFASSAKQGEVDNFPNLLRGWGISFEQTGGIPPMEWFNFLFKRLDEKHTYLMQRGLPEWSATQDYTKGSCVQFDGVSYRALKNSKNNSPNESDSQYWVRWGFALSEIAQAKLTQYGITKLYTGYDSQSEDLALTPKTAYQLKQLIDSNTRSLGNFIPNSKKSSAVNSNSADTVATSAAVKTAYDKGVEAKNAADNAQRTANDGVSKANAAQTSANQAKSAADTAQRTANDGVSKANEANNNANGRVPKTGDTTIIGTVRVQHQQLNAGSWSELQLAAKEGYWRLEVNPNSHDANERRFNMVYANGNAQHYLQFPTIGDSGQTVAYQEWVNAQLGDYAQQKGLGSADLDTITKSGIYGQDASSNATTARHYPEQKAGMLIVTAQSGYGAQQVYIPYDTHRLYVRGRNANQWQNWQRVDGIDSIALSSISHATNGNNKTKVASEFALGELNKRMDKLINESIYHKHYDGAKVLRLRVDNNGGWKIIKMKASRINVPSNGEVILNLPEAITMDSVITATDDGNAKFSYGAVMMSATTIKIFAIAGRTIGINITIMGGGAF